MHAVFALVVVIAAAQPSGPPTAVQLVRDACVDTGMNRDALEQLARERRWRSIRTRSSGPGRGWNVAYRVRDAQVMLRGMPGSGVLDPSVGSICVVDMDTARGDWLTEISNLAVDLGLEADSLPELPGEGDMRIWSSFGGYTLTSTHDPASRRIVISLSRQLVLIESD